MAKKSKDTFTPDVAKYLQLILHGRVLAIDPASKSMGWAMYYKGELVNSGEIAAPKMNTAPAWKRIGDMMAVLGARGMTFDVMLIEKLGKNVPLIWSVGAAIGVLKPQVMIEVHYQKWHPFRPDDYIKTDKLDAELIGLAVITEARAIQKDIDK